MPDRPAERGPSGTGHDTACPECGTPGAAYGTHVCYAGSCVSRPAEPRVTEAAPAPPYTPGRFVVSWIGADGARDPIALTSQVKVMREGFELLGHKPALLLIVVADAEVDAAADLVREALDA